MSTRQRLVVVGAGGHGREVLDVVEALGHHDVIGFVDDGEPDTSLLTARGVPLLGGRDALIELARPTDDVVYVLGLGAAATRAAVGETLASAGLRAAGPLVHPLASVGSVCTIGAGSVLAAGARITTDVVLGEHSYVGSNAVVGHDCVLGVAATVYPGAIVSGDVHIGRAATIGAGAAVRQGVRIGDGATVGLGAAVVSDVPDGATVAGVPARPLDAD